LIKILHNVVVGWSEYLMKNFHWVTSHWYWVERDWLAE